MTRIRFDGSEEKPQSQPLDCDPPENGATLARLHGGSSRGRDLKGGEGAARLLSRGGVKAGPPQTSSGLGGASDVSDCTIPGRDVGSADFRVLTLFVEQ